MPLEVNSYIYWKDGNWHVYTVRKRYLRLWGTVLYVYKSKAECIDNRTPPLLTVSMQRVDAGMATEFKRRPRVLRLWIPNGEQYLLRLDDVKDMVSWIEHLQAAANISMDLDHRRMPRFVTMIRPNNNSSGHTFNLDLGDEQRTVVSICRSRCWINISYTNNKENVSNHSSWQLTPTDKF